MKTERLIYASIVVFGLVMVLYVFFRDEIHSKRFKENYRIDLKSDGYLVYDVHDGTTHFVRTGELEEFFINDNI